MCPLTHYYKSHDKLVDNMTDNGLYGQSVVPPSDHLTGRPLSELFFKPLSLYINKTVNLCDL